MAIFTGLQVSGMKITYGGRCQGRGVWETHSAKRKALSVVRGSRFRCSRCCFDVSLCILICVTLYETSLKSMSISWSKLSRVGHRADHIPGCAMIRIRRARWPALRIHKVSFSIRPAGFLPGGPPPAEHLKPKFRLQY